VTLCDGQTFAFTQQYFLGPMAGNIIW